MKLPSLLSLSLLITGTLAIDINVNDAESIKAAAKIAAQKLRYLYPTNETWFIPGEFGLIQTPDGKNNQGFWWWQGGAAMGAWIDYWAFTGDDSYNEIVTEAMLFQVGPEYDYQPPNQTAQLANDDQSWWAIAALAAAERGLPSHPGGPQWIVLAEAVFNLQAARWDSDTCGGGLRWQIFPTHRGYDYKNSITNGLFFQIGARLARYTGNQTYAELAERSWLWSKNIGLIGSDYNVYDGAHVPGCTVSDKTQWTYNGGVYLSGCAYLYDYYNSRGNTDKANLWKMEVMNLLRATDEPFFNRNDTTPNIMRETACEAPVPFTQLSTCNTDQRSFKAYLARFFSHTYQLCDFTRDYIMTRFKASAEAAAKCCNGGDDGQTCGLSWIRQTYDTSTYGIAKGGVGEHMAVMALIGALLTPNANSLYTEKTAQSNSVCPSGDDLRPTEPVYSNVAGYQNVTSHPNASATQDPLHTEKTVTSNSVYLSGDDLRPTGPVYSNVAGYQNVTSHPNASPTQDPLHTEKTATSNSNVPKGDGPLRLSGGHISSTTPVYSDVHLPTLSY